jgi:hypothetical protein
MLDGAGDNMNITINQLNRAALTGITALEAA